jgi:hypothetical protein
MKDDEMVRECSTHGEEWNAYRILVGKQKRKGLVGRPRYMWEGIKLDPRDKGWGDMD